MELMKAVVYNKKGSPDKLVFKTVEKPSPTDNEVLIKIYAASINAADYRSMQMGIIPKKKIFGADVSGKVESVGKNIQKFNPGDEVIGDLSDFGFGGFAEYAVAPEKAFVSKPANITYEVAAAIPLAGITALQAIRNKANIQKGYQVLIVGSSGGVGTFAVQLAKYFGAEVTAVCSTRNLEQTSILGADNIIDYTQEDFTKSDKAYDLILAVNGNYSLFAYRRILNKHGVYVMIGGALMQIIKTLLFAKLLSLGSKKMYSIFAKSNQKDLEFVVKLVEGSNIKSIIEQRFPLDKTALAMRYVGEGHAQGKVVINVD